MAPAGPAGRLARMRADHPRLDRVVRAGEHYSATEGSQQAGAITYFAFLSFFPVLALAFFAVGWIAEVYPGAADDLTTAVNEVLPGLVGEGDDQISLDSVRDSANTVGLLGLLGVVYAGTGWLAALRAGLVTTFELDAAERPNLVMGKLRDLVSLVVLGAILLLGVAASSLVGVHSRDLLDWAGFSVDLVWVVGLLTWAVGLATGALLFWCMFRILARPPLPAASLWSGALLGAVAFEALKRVSGLLLASTRQNEAFAVFGVALILLVWINWFSRVILLAASWAHTSDTALRLRSEEAAALARENAPEVQGPPVSPGGAAAAPDRFAQPAVFAAGAGAMLALVRLLRRRDH